MAQLDSIRLSGTTYDIIDATAIHSLDGYYTTGETIAAITAATNALAESIAEQNYATTGYVQDAIAESSGVITGQVQSMIDQSVSGKVSTDTYTAYTASTDSVLSGKANISDIPSVSGYADSVTFNDTSKYVEFYHGGTGGTKVYEFNAAPFLIDGMVQNVEIKDVTISGESVTCLVISFNTDAGRQDINIPISEVFDASNYYTKTEVDTALTGKADLSALTEDEQILGRALNDLNEKIVSVSGVTSGKANSSDVYLKTETSGATEISTALSGKQATLVNQENIKSINGNSLLGSGDLTVDTGLHAEVSGTTLIFS